MSFYIVEENLPEDPDYDWVNHYGDKMDVLVAPHVSGRKYTESNEQYHKSNMWNSFTDEQKIEYLKREGNNGVQLGRGLAIAKRKQGTKLGYPYELPPSYLVELLRGLLFEFIRWHTYWAADYQPFTDEIADEARDELNRRTLLIRAIKKRIIHDKGKDYLARIDKEMQLNLISNRKYNEDKISRIIPAEVVHKIGGYAAEWKFGNLLRDR